MANPEGPVKPPNCQVPTYKRARNGNFRPRSARAGFGLLETLVAVAMFAVLAISLLHARSVMIRAERQVSLLNQARLHMRDMVALSRAGVPAEEWREKLPDKWRLTITADKSEIMSAAATNLLASWFIWRLEHIEGHTELEIVKEGFIAETGEFPHE